MKKIPVICITAACSGMGKTTFLEKLIIEFEKRGYRVGAVKSDCHGFNIDIPGKDSWRLAEAGAAVTAITGPDKYAVIYKTNQRKNLDQIVSNMEGVDIILAEGFKDEAKPKIEIIREEKGRKIATALENLAAIVTDITDFSSPVPKFCLDDIIGVAEFIIEKYL